MAQRICLSELLSLLLLVSTSGSSATFFFRSQCDFLIHILAKDEFPKSAWLVSKMGRLTVGVQYEPLCGTIFFNFC